MPKISCIASFSPHFLFLFRTRCFLASSPLPLFFFCRFVVLSHFGNVCAQSGAAPPLAAAPPAPEMKCLRAVNLSDSRRKGSATGGRAGQGRAGGSSCSTWRGGVVQSIYRHVHSLQVCAAVATPAGMADYVPPRVPASLRASSGSLAPTWPLTTSKSAKCQVFALVSSPATYIPCAAAPHTPFSPPPYPTSSLSLLRCLFLLAFFATKFWRCDIF